MHAMDLLAERMAYSESAQLAAAVAALDKDLQEAQAAAAAASQQREQAMQLAQVSPLPCLAAGLQPNSGCGYEPEEGAGHTAGICEASALLRSWRGQPINVCSHEPAERAGCPAGTYEALAPPHCCCGMQNAASIALCGLIPAHMAVDASQMQPQHIAGANLTAEMSEGSTCFFSQTGRMRLPFLCAFLCRAWSMKLPILTRSRERDCRRRRRS